MAKQYGFYFDSDRCIQCRTCEVACTSIHSLEPGLKWRKVVETWCGEIPDAKISFFSWSCMHCGQPACAAACPTGAISKRAEDGIVVVDKEQCNGCQECFFACPFDIPQFGSDGTMQKCDFCLGRGEEPACVSHCLTEAIKYGVMANPPTLAAGKVADRLPGATKPSMVILHNS